jgi:hypothetical protein
MYGIWKPTNAWQGLDIEAHLARINKLAAHDIAADTLKKILTIPSDPPRVVVPAA